MNDFKMKLFEQRFKKILDLNKALGKELAGKGDRDTLLDIVQEQLKTGQDLLQQIRRWEDAGHTFNEVDKKVVQSVSLMFDAAGKLFASLQDVREQTKQ